MQVQAFEPSLEEAWNGLVARARNGHFLFDRRFMTYHSDRFQDASLVAVEDGRLAAVVPANRAGETVWSHQGLTFGGVVTEAVRTTEVMQVLDACADHWKAAGARRLIYKPLPWIYHRRPAQEDLYWLFRRDARLVRRDLSAAIRTAEPGPRSQRRRRGAARAEKAGVRLGRSDRWDAFWTVLAEVLGGRHGARPVHALEEITLLAGRFPEHISLHLAEGPDGEVLAGVVLFCTPQVAHAQYIAASDAGRDLGALDALFAHLITTEGGSRSFFDFGISNEDAGRVLNEGLIRQKEEFGASGVAHDCYEVEL